MVKGKSVGGAVGVFGKGSNGSEEAGKETIYMDCDLKSWFFQISVFMGLLLERHLSHRYWDFIT